MGEERVGIGTNFTQDYDKEFFDWITHDKGFGRKLTEFGPVIHPEGFRRISDFPNLAGTMERAGWTETRMRRVLGENCLNLLGRVWKV